MLVSKVGVLNCVFRHCLTNLSLFFRIIIVVFRNVFKGVFSEGHGSGGGVGDEGGASGEAVLAVCAWC